MHIHIHLFRLDLDEESAQRKATDHQHRVIGLHDGGGQRRILHPATIDENRDVLCGWSE